MEMGQRLKQARLDAGLSQRQLCGEIITRNMLSQIENGAARPSMETLSHLAERLGKPVSYFLDEDAVTSPNQQVMAQARNLFAQSCWQDVVRALADYRKPDPIFDWEKSLLLARSLLVLARQALQEGRKPYARQLLHDALSAAEETPYGGEELKAAIQVLFSAAGEPGALPNVDNVLLYQAQAALEGGDALRAGILLDAASEHSAPLWKFLRGKAWFTLGNYDRAVPNLQGVEDTFPEADALLERCFAALENYKMAYYYACRQKGQSGVKLPVRFGQYPRGNKKF